VYDMSTLLSKCVKITYKFGRYKKIYVRNELIYDNLILLSHSTEYDNAIMYRSNIA